MTDEQKVEDPALDPEFEAALRATLALDPTERVSRLSDLTDQLQQKLDEG